MKLFRQLQFRRVRGVGQGDDVRLSLQAIPGYQLNFEKVLLNYHFENLFRTQVKWNFTHKKKR